MTLPDDVQSTPQLPLDQDGGPVFTSPWEARVFAMTLQAYEAGLFNWSEWTEMLGAELAGDKGNGGGVADYYDHWLRAFEKLLTAKGIVETGQLTELRSAWDRAARSTPHGQPILLNSAGA